ncbi:LysR family transcriptional regulator, partial [Glaesserella parasuis]|nr:LysR family transcriptional regulator [Glaesserella parasuis]MDP0481640.1 LysR family transcriptional regulator [Glaesserella parasuis]
VFLTVAETGSFTATAERLEISKPMISRYVALMEEWLNARLFSAFHPQSCSNRHRRTSGAFLSKNC